MTSRENTLRHQHHVKEAMNLRGKLTSSINYRYMIGFRANNRQHVIGAFCNFHVNSKQRETNEVRVQPLVGRIVA